MTSDAAQLESFAKAIVEHPFRRGVANPSRQSKDPLTCLRIFADHYAKCTHCICMGYQTAFLIAYFSHLSEEGLRELVSALRQMELGNFLYVVRRMIDREAKRGRKPEAVYLRRLKERDLRVRELASNLQEIKEEIQPGRILATHTWGTRVQICGFTLSGGQEFLVPGISTGEERDYLSLTVVTNSLIWREPLHWPE